MGAGQAVPVQPLNQKPVEKKTICVDFDGTIVDSTYPKIHGLKAGVKDALTILKSLGYYIIISSCRSCGWNWELYYPGQPFTPAAQRSVFQDMKLFLDANDIPYDEIDDGTKGKVSADYYIDDKAVRFTDNWPVIAYLIHKTDIETMAAQAQAQPGVPVQR